MHRRADLVLVAAALRLDRVARARARETGSAGSVTPVGLVAERVVGKRVLQLRHRAPRSPARRFRARSSAFCPGAARRSRDARPRRASCYRRSSSPPSAHPRRDAEHRDAPGEGSATVFQTTAGQRRRSRERPLGLLAPSWRSVMVNRALPPATARTRRSHRAAAGAPMLTWPRRAEQTGNSFARTPWPRARPATSCSCVSVPSLEELLHQRFVGLGDYLDRALRAPPRAASADSVSPGTSGSARNLPLVIWQKRHAPSARRDR